MIKSVSLWHVTPTDLGVEFLDPSITTLEADEKLYALVNDPNATVDRKAYSKIDFEAIGRMRAFLGSVRLRIEGDKSITFEENYPGVPGCIAKYQLTESMSCYVLTNGTAVFFEAGEEVPIEDVDYFSLPAFLFRQEYEDDYCINPENSPRKAPLYSFLQLMWKCVGTKKYTYSASPKFRNNGVSYTLCITMINDPELVSNRVDLQMKKNMRALLDTSAFNNIYQKDQWPVIRQRIDNDDISDLELQELSENLVFADNWSGVLLAGDLDRNQHCISWFLEFEIFLQSHWLLFDAYCENVIRQDWPAMELQAMLNRVEFTKVQLDNDISSNMEQSRHIMRNSLIKSSDINVIYSRMHGIISNKLKMKLMSDEKERSRYSLLSEVSLLIIALLQIYGVVEEFLGKEVFTQTDVVTMAVMLVVTVVCVVFMIKGRI